ncbi:eukaryotic-like serine/threonine-protein kinase [Phycisphaerales bacterium]|nr:eukaryotic-like serine/threonine-protein kinase [Phycisphaerales bacterium]
MNVDRLKRAEELYFDIAALPTTEREPALAQACSGDPGLADEVRALLRAGADLGGFLEEPPLGTDFLLLASPATNGEAPDDLLGRRVGRYRIETRIASGGMGTVYEAVREDEFRQRVAIKVVKRGMDSEDILRRFRAERQTLAALNHPYVARLLDGGATPDGRPFLVMEFVEGKPIDAYCDEKRMPLVDRLRLFRRVCDGIKSAHQALVVHRDIKPSNILVTPDGTPKLLDFGISKVLSGTDTIDITLTSADQRRLTPEYASPEQVRGEPITTASDVYSLGVVLYELLTGSRPYQFATRTLSEIEKVVCTAQPPLPSAAITRTGSPDAAPSRGGTVERVRRGLKGDLDTIVLCALHKDLKRRYPTVEALAGDIDRYLEGRPVTAQKDTITYRVGKFVKRNALGTTLAGAATLSLVAGTALASWQANRASLQRDQAYDARDAAEEIAEYLQKALQASDVMQMGLDLRVVDVVDGAAARLEADLGNRPLTKAAVQSAIGRTYVALGDYEKAEHHIVAAYRLRQELLAPGHHDIAESKMDLAQLYHATGRPVEGERELRDALVIHQQLRGEQNLDTARVWNDLGAVLRLQGRLDDAEDAHRRALSARELLSGHESLEVAESLNNLSGVMMARKDFERAEKTMREARSIRLRLLAPDHPLAVQATQNLGTIIGTRGDFARAEPYLRESLEGSRRAYQPGHPAIASILTSLGNCLGAMDRRAEAEPLLREAVQIRRAKLREEDPQLAFSEVSLGRVLYKLGKSEEAEACLRPALEKVLAPGQKLGAKWVDGATDLLAILDARGATLDAAELRAALPQ